MVATVIVLVLTGRMLAPTGATVHAMSVGAGVVLAILVARLADRLTRTAPPLPVLMVAAGRSPSACWARWWWFAGRSRDGVELGSTDWWLIALAAAIPLCIWATGLFSGDQGHPVPMSRVHTLGRRGGERHPGRAGVGTAGGAITPPSIINVPRRLAASWAGAADAGQLHLLRPRRFGRHQLHDPAPAARLLNLDAVRPWLMGLVSRSRYWTPG